MSATPLAKEEQTLFQAQNDKTFISAEREIYPANNFQNLLASKLEVPKLTNKINCMISYAVSGKNIVGIPIFIMA